MSRAASRVVRRRVLWYGGLGAGGAAMALLVWGLAIEPRLVVEEHVRAPLPHAAACWDGAVVAFIADLQIGAWLDNDGTARRIVERIVRASPAAALVGGDLVYHPLESDDEIDEVREERDPEGALRTIARAIAILRPLTDAGIPTFAVLGNHEYGMAIPGVYTSPWLAGKVGEALTAIGVQVLHNDARRLPPWPACQGRDAPLWIAGIGPHLPHEDDPRATVAAVPRDAPRIVVMHNPLSFAALPAGSAPVALAGHTHGAQVRLPFVDEWSWYGLFTDYEHDVDGWVAHYGRPGNRLYITRGIGFSGVPVRINAPPELTWLTINAG